MKVKYFKNITSNGKYVDLLTHRNAVVCGVGFRAPYFIVLQIQSCRYILVQTSVRLNLTEI